MTYRETLLNTRPKAGAYAASVEMLPSLITGMKGVIGDIAIAPVKSFQMLTLPMDTPEDGARIGEYGLTTLDASIPDRGLALGIKKPGRTHDGTAYELQRLSQRQQGALARIRPHLEDGVLSYDVQGTLFPPLEPFVIRQPKPVPMLMSSQTGEVRMVSVDEGPLMDSVHALLKAAGVSSENVHVTKRHANHVRPVNAMHRCGTNATTLLSDGGQVTIGSGSTVEWMNEERLKADAYAYPIGIRQFRMNITLEGLMPNAEDFIAEIEIGPNRIPLRFGGLSVRCVMTCLDPDTGENLGKDPLRFLGNERPSRPGDPKSTTFGVNCVFPPETIGQVIRPGMMFEVTKEKE